MRIGAIPPTEPSEPDPATWAEILFGLLLASAGFAGIFWIILKTTGGY